VQQLQVELEAERQGSKAASETIKRLQDDKEQLRNALNQLQESLKSTDSTGRVEELVRQAQAAQNESRALEIKLAEAEKMLETSKRDHVSATLRMKVRPRFSPMFLVISFNPNSFLTSCSKSASFFFCLFLAT